MPTFQETKDQAEQKVIMHLLSEIERNPAFTQRKLAMELDIALGLINRYLKRCINKGWIKVSQTSPKRIRYFLTPEGFMEKSQMVGHYLTRSLTFFRDARLQCENIFVQCAAQGKNNLAFLGGGDLADIAMLVSQGTGIKGTIVSAGPLNEDKDTVIARLKDFDAVLITDINYPQATFDLVKDCLPADRLLTLPLLYISDQREAA